MKKIIDWIIAIPIAAILIAYMVITHTWIAWLSWQWFIIGHLPWEMPQITFMQMLGIRLFFGTLTTPLPVTTKKGKEYWLHILLSPPVALICLWIIHTFFF